MKETILRNATVVLPEGIIKGTVVLEGAYIKHVDDSPSSDKSGLDMEGDLLMPGLIEMHTDNLEKYIVPRPGIYWPSSLASLIAHDNQIFNSGITTVMDSIAVGYLDDQGLRKNILERSVESVRFANENRLLKADHYIHLRCELPSTTVYDSFCRYAEDSLLKLVSVMDHTPGQRQWKDLSKWRLYHKDKKWTDEEAQEILLERQKLKDGYATENRKRIVRDCLEMSIPTASHDDTLPEHCKEASEEGITISEFPTTVEAAQQAKELGMSTIMGAPNMVRGESHSGNISAEKLAELGLLDGFSSDFMPISLLHAAFELNRRLDIELHAALATVTSNIASMVNLPDRGVIEPGKRADLIRVSTINDLPLVKTIWKDGKEMVATP